MTIELFGGWSILGVPLFIETAIDCLGCIIVASVLRVVGTGIAEITHRLLCSSFGLCITTPYQSKHGKP